MFARYEVSPEMLVMSAIQALDGFDLTFVGDRNLVGRQRGEGREYYHSDNHVAEELGRWLQQLADYDADPGEFMQAIARRTEQRRRGQ
ncbi:MAG: hypothetical protein GY743_00080 [Planctomycetaceae bacterium]|nr:hypothetical protein [Planctomycetaceae bacterium]